MVVGRIRRDPPTPPSDANPSSQDSDAALRQRAQDILSLKEVAEAGAKGQ
jgi:hypothetical protein